MGERAPISHRRIRIAPQRHRSDNGDEAREIAREMRAMRPTWRTRLAERLRERSIRMTISEWHSLITWASVIVISLVTVTSIWLLE